MKRRISLSVCSVILVAVFFCAGNTNAQTSGVANEPNYHDVTNVPRVEVDSWLKDRMRESGASVNQGKYRFIIGFSTGHFNTDPVHAIAMRRLAFSLLNNTFALGDNVQAAAWEMDVWKCTPSITLTDDPASRQEFVNNVPYSPEAGSRGGHDIEKTLYDLLKLQINASDAPHTAIILMTNSDESQSPSGTQVRLFGANNPLLLDAIRQKGYRYPPERKSFQMNAGKRVVTVDVVALFPSKLSPIAGTAQESRYPTFALNTWQPVADTPAPKDIIPNPTITGHPVPIHPSNSVRQHRKRNLWLPIAGLILIILVILYLISYLISGKTKIPKTKPKAKAPPKGKPLKGSVAYTIGIEPQKKLQPLTTQSKWRLVRDGTGKTEITDDNPPADGKPPANLTELAKLNIEKNSNKKYILKVESCDGFQFSDFTPIIPGIFNFQTLKLEPGDGVLCNVLDDNAQKQVKISFIYNKTN
jgi:hypothetical protein